MKNMTLEEIVIFPELDNLVKLINTLPGVEVFECEYSNSDRISVWFKSTDRRGLFILTRAISKRYFSQYENWIISVTTGDQFLNNYLPVYFSLFSLKGRNECKSDIPLIINAINKLLKDKSTLDAYNLGNLAK